MTELLNSYSPQNHRASLADAPRPCYYIFRILGSWQPGNGLWILKVYGHVSFMIWLASLSAVVALGYLHVHKFRWEDFLNTCGTCLNLGCPFLFTKYYFRTGTFDELVFHVVRSSASSKKFVSNLAKIYTAISTLLWILGFVFFYAHWLPFFYRWWHHVVYSIALFYTTGYWASWLSLYGFVCHIHRIDVINFQNEMKEIFSRNLLVQEDEEQYVTALFIKFYKLEEWLHKSQKAFSKIISFSVAYHIADMVVFSVAYFEHDFGVGYPPWQYAGGMLFDLLSILMKLYPAAVLSQALHDLMIAAGGHCLSGVLNYVPHSRVTFYQFLYLRDQDIGFHILGVKITVKLAMGIFVTIATAAATFLRIFIGSF